MEFKREKRERWEWESLGWGLGSSRWRSGNWTQRAAHLRGCSALRGGSSSITPVIPPLFPLFPFPALPRTHQSATETLQSPPLPASGENRKWAEPRGRGGRGAPPIGHEGVVPPSAAMLGGAGVRINLMAFFNQ